MRIRERERRKEISFYKSELSEMSKPKNTSIKAKSHFKRKPYSKDTLIID